jgi:NhaA family Na+:H+ antiporter
MRPPAPPWGGLSSCTTETPLDQLQRSVHPLVSLVVLPLLALVNAGVTFSPDTLEKAMLSSVALGVILGLMVGQTIGITCALGQLSGSDVHNRQTN